MPSRPFAPHDPSPKMRTSAPSRWAIVRVTIETSGDDPGMFVVRIKPRQCPRGLFRGVAHGTIPIGIIDELNDTYLEDFADSVGCPEPEILNRASKRIRKHAQVLVRFLWDSTLEYDKAWWERLCNSVECPVIELVLCKELRRYAWEALLTLTEFPSRKTAIVRLIEDPSVAPAHGQGASPTRLALLSRQAADLRSLHGTAQDCLDRLKGKGWTQVVAPAGKGELKALQEAAANHEQVILVYIGHGQNNDGTGELMLDDGRGQPDWVGPGDLLDVLPDVKHLTLVLVACDTGLSALIDGWLALADVVVAMQFPFSQDAAATFVKALLADEPNLPDLDSLPGVVHQVADCRAALATDQHYRVERSTPVLCSSQPLEIARRWGRIAAALAIGLLALAAVAAYLAAPWVPPCTAAITPAFTVDGTPIAATRTYTVTLSNGELPDLVVKADIAAKPAWCRSQPATDWAVIGDDWAARPLDDLDGFLTIPVQAPPAGEAVILHLHAQDKRTLNEVYTYLVLQCVHR